MSKRQNERERIQEGEFAPREGQHGNTEETKLSDFSMVAFIFLVYKSIKSGTEGKGLQMQNYKK